MEIQSPRQRPQPEPVELAIVYEDDWLIALDKPPGLIVHPTYKHASGTLLNGVLWRYRDRPAVQPGILTRLDKGTSGLVIVALSATLHAAMQREAASMRKEYLAVVERNPEPPNGTIRLPLSRDAADRRRVVVNPAGAPCETRYDRLGPYVRCQLVTGRTHQIRVHLASIGCPIVGDVTYGQASTAIARQALHAWRASLRHPATRARLDLEAAVPSDIRALVE